MTIKEVNERIAELLETNQREIANAKAELRRIDEEEAALLSRSAEDPEEQHKTRLKLDELNDHRLFYSDRLRKLTGRQFVTDEESEATIAGILAEEKVIAVDYETKVCEIAEQLRELTEEYAGSVAEAERTLNRWTTAIHANYIDGAGTRRDYAVPVRPLPYTGGRIRQTVERFLARMGEAEKTGGRA